MLICITLKLKCWLCFCPKDIVCGCKDNKPFCKCPYYRGLWGDYWYMGHKCEQLWNSLDLILVTVLPAVALAFLVGVIVQCVYYCKNKSNKSVKGASSFQFTSCKYCNAIYIVKVQLTNSTQSYFLFSQLLRQTSLFTFTGDNAAHFLFTMSPEREDKHSHGTAFLSTAFLCTGGHLPVFIPQVSI
uniref:Uncharacterized protein n=1 Tax=Chelydra serpentina TaxID=8475 RepID=A0A8C3RLQ7_CHESE